MFPNYDSAVAEAKLLHSRDVLSGSLASDARYFSIFRKTGGRPVQRSYRMTMLEDVVLATAGHEDTYMSQSSFWCSNRKAVNFKQTRAAWVDLDLYNIDRKVDSATVRQILQHAQALAIPVPTAVIFSGRGCYLKWVFEVPVTQTQLPVWQTLQATLTAAFSALAADFSARDASRVFRLLQTKNSKSGELVEVIDGSGVLYDFVGLCQSVEGLRLDLLVEQKGAAVVSPARKSAKRATLLSERLLGLSERGDIDALNFFTELRRPIMLEKLSECSLNWGRFCDLRNLYAQRGGIPVGERDQAMFWMLNFLSHAQVVHASNWESEIKDLSQAFPSHETFKPLEDGSMSSLLSRLKHKEAGIKYSFKGRDVSPLYRPSNRFLIDAFQIAPAEMAQLGVIISADEKRARVDEKVLGRSARRSERNRWREEVVHAFAGQQESLKAQAAEQVSFVGGAQNANSQTASAAVNLSALAIYLGVERTRVQRFWSGLVRQAEHAVTQKSQGHQRLDQASLGADDILAAYEPLHEALDAKAMNFELIEGARLAKLATFKAIEARQAQSKLAFARQGASMQESWLRRKMANLLIPVENDTTEHEKTMATTGLSRKMALLEAARAVERGERLPQLSNMDIEANASMRASLRDSQTALEQQQRIQGIYAATAADAQTSTSAPGVAVDPAEIDDDEHYEEFSASDGYQDFFSAPKSQAWSVASAQALEGVSLDAIERGPNVTPLPNEAYPLERESFKPDAVSAEIAQPQPVAALLGATEHLPVVLTPLLAATAQASPPAGMSAAERLRAKIRLSARPNPVSASPVSVPPAVVASDFEPAQVSAVATGTPKRAETTQPPSSVAPIVQKPILLAPTAASSPVPAPAFVSAAKPALSATDRLRALASRVSTLPPLQRESKVSAERVELAPGCVGAPIRYPTHEEWPGQSIPPGSHYSQQEWDASRTGEAGQVFEVIEVQSASKSFLMQLEVPKTVTSKKLVNGVLITTRTEMPPPVDSQDSQQGINSLMRQFFSDCLLVAVDSYPSFPGAVDAGFVYNDAQYRVIRARQDYLDADRAFRVGAVMKLGTTASEVMEKTSPHDGDNADDNDAVDDSVPKP